MKNKPYAEMTEEERKAWFGYAFKRIKNPHDFSSFLSRFVITVNRVFEKCFFNFPYVVTSPKPLQSHVEGV